MEDKIKITKDNYKEYIELYEEIVVSRFEVKRPHILVVLIILGMFTVCGPILSIAPPLVGALVTLLYCSVLTYGIDKHAKKANIKKREKIKQKYPNKNINVDVKSYELEQALKKAGIIRYEKDGEYTIKVIDTKFFEQKIQQEEFIEKCEKRKQDMFEKNKYDYVNCTIEPYVSEQELTKVKEQVKTLVKKKM